MPSFGIDTTDIKRALAKEVADMAPTVANAVLAKLKPQLNGIIEQATDTAVKRLEPQIPRLVNKAISAAQGRLILPTKAKVVLGIVGAVWLSSSVFAFLAWRNTRRR